MQVAIDARYLCEPFGSMTVFCSGLLHALATIDSLSPPVALLPRELHESAIPLAEELGDRVRWISAPQDRYRDGRLLGELTWVQREIPRILLRDLPATDVLLMPYHHPPARIEGVRRVVFVHDLCGLGKGFPKHKKAFWRHYLRLRAAAHLSDSIWPVSRSTSQALATRFGAASKRLGPVLYNVVDREVVSDDKLRAALRARGLERNGYVVAFATRQERKNFATTLSAMAHLQRQGGPMKLVGVAPRGQVDDIRRWCQREGLLDTLIVSGLPDDELDALYAGALALVWPSTCEGFGYPVLEAMTQGCPALVWEVGPGAELVGETTLPLSHRDGPHLAKRLVELRALNARDRATLADRCRERASLFAMDRYRDRLQGALREAVRAH